MASLSFPPLVLPVTLPLPDVAPVTAAVPVAAVVAEAEALPFSLPQAIQPAPLPPGDAGADPAALRPDQVIMARQLTYAAPDAPALAAGWRAMVRSYAAQLTSRDQRARTGHLPAELLAATQDTRLSRGIDASGTILPDAWRFTVHARGPQEQYLAIVMGDPDQQSGRRRRGRAALQLELTLWDGARVVVQAEALPGGLGLDLCSTDAGALERLREMQPALAVAVGRAGLRVLRWNYRDTLPASQVHARQPSLEAASALTLPVFRALAELALLLPARPVLER